MRCLGNDTELVSLKIVALEIDLQRAEMVDPIIRQGRE